MNLLILKVSVGPPYILTHTIWSKSDWKYGRHKQISDFFSEKWLSFSKITPHLLNLLISRNLVWDHHTNSLIQFWVNRTKNMAAIWRIVIFSEIWQSFSIMTPHRMNLLILRDIVWDQHTNSLIQFGVNRTKNMAARGKLVIFLYMAKFFLNDHWKNLLILSDIVWNHHTNSLIKFWVNQTKNMAASTKNSLLMHFCSF